MRSKGSEPLDELLSRHADWWERRGQLHSQIPYVPMSPLWLPLSNGSTATHDLDLTPDMLDLERLAGPPLEAGPLERIGDAIHTRQPYVRVPWVEAVLGCPIRTTIQGGSMRTRAFVISWEDWQHRDLGLSQAWLEALATLTQLMVERSGGRYAVAHTLMRGPADLAEAVLGPELMCLSMYDAPDKLRAFLEEATETFLLVLETQMRYIPSIQGGYVNPFGVWAPGTVVRTQCDASAFLSAEQYAQWFLPYDVRISEAVDQSVIHLHSGSLHTVETLLAVERPHAIQISLDPQPSGPPVLDLIPIFRRILEVKPLIIDGPVSPQEEARLNAELPADGRYLLIHRGQGMTPLPIQPNG